MKLLFPQSCFKRPQAVATALGVMLLCGQGVGTLVAYAARKYVPNDAAVSKPERPKIIENNDVVIPPKVIVKTVLVPVQAKKRPKDPFTNLMDDHRFYEALRVIDQRLQKEPDNIYLQLTRAQVLRLDQDYQLAEEAYQNIFPQIKSKNLLSQAYYGFAMLRFNQAEQFRRLADETTQKALLDEAVSLFQKSIEAKPTLDAWSGLANIALLQGRLDDCEQALKKAGTLAPNHLAVHLTRGYLALAENNPELASQEGYRIRKQAPDDPRALMLLGRAAMAESRYDDAIIHFRQLSERLPENTEALHWLSRAYEQKDRLDEAEAVLEKAVFINPFDWEATQSLMSLYEREGDSKRSILLAKTLLSQVNAKEQKEGTSYPLYHMMLDQALLTRLVQTRQWPEAYPLARKITETCYQTLKPTGMVQVNTNVMAQISVQNKNITPATVAINTPLSPSSDPQQQSLAAYCTTNQNTRLELLAQSAYFSGESMVYWSRFYDDLIIKQALVDILQGIQTQPNNASLRLAALFLDPITTLPPATLPSNSSFQIRTYRLQEAFLTGNRSEYETLFGSISTDELATPKDRLMLAERLYDLGDLHGARSIAGHVPVSTGLALQEQVKELLNKISMQEQDIPNRLKALKTVPKDENSQFWVRMATQALRSDPYNAKLRASVADALAHQQDFTSANIQYRLAAQYASSSREKAGFLRKAERISGRIQRVPSTTAQN